MWNKLLPIVCMLVLSCSSAGKEDQPIKKEQQPIKEPPDTTTVIQPVAKKINKAPLNLLGGKVQLDMPEHLQSMDKKMFDLKYPLENAENTRAYSDGDGTVTLLISPRQDKATQTDLPKYQQMLNNSFSNNPSIDFKKSEIKQINGRDFIVIEMITPAMDTDVYNLMFVTSLDGKLLIGTFNCTIEKMQEWQPIAEQILSSVKVKD